MVAGAVGVRGAISVAQENARQSVAKTKEYLGSSPSFLAGFVQRS